MSEAEPTTTIKHVIKRSGEVVDFDPSKIKNAINKAFTKGRYVGEVVVNDQGEVCKLNGKDVNLSAIVAKVTDLLDKWHGETNADPDIETIQDVVVTVLRTMKFGKIAGVYLNYRFHRAKVRDGKIVKMETSKEDMYNKKDEKTQTAMIDSVALVGNYLHRNDWRINENANAGYSYASMLNHVSGIVVANYTLETCYKGPIADAHLRGDMHIHDLTAGVIGYCSGWSLRQLLLEGFTGNGGRASAAPAKHFDTVLGQIANFMSTLQTEWAGAQAFSSFDTFLAPFVRHDELDYKQVKQDIQQFIFMMNIASRWGQTPFTNLTMDLTCPEDLKEYPVIIGGVMSDTDVYGNFQYEMDMINKAFLEVMSAGDRDGRIFTFPIPTYNITKDFDFDSELAQLLFLVTGKYGVPNFQNFVNSELNPSDTRSMCCRLQIDKRELRNRGGGGLFGAGEHTGSLGVVTINMPRIGYLSKDENEFFDRLNSIMTLAKDSLEIRRKLVTDNFNNGLMPYSKIYLENFNTYFNTIGLNGMNECCLNFLGENIASSEGHAFAVKVLKYMRDKLSDFQEETGNLYNLEATPAEGTSFRLANIDKKLYPDIITAGTTNPYYTNSTHLPVNYTDDIFEALDLQDDLQSLYTGGTMFHGFIGERIEDPKAVGELVKAISSGYKLPYFTITPTYSICPEHGYISGWHETCPMCKNNN